MKIGRVILSMMVLAVILFSFSGVFAQGTGLKLDDPAPAFKLESMDGDTLELSKFAGKVVVLHFWHSN